MNFLKHFWLKRALRRVARKPAPNRIPLSGERALENDFYHADLRILDGSYSDILVQTVSPRGFAGIAWNEEEDGYSIGTSVCYQFLGSYQIRISKYYRGHEFTFRNPMSFILQEFFKLPLVEIFADRTFQGLFNFRTPTRQSRIKILKKLISQREQNAAERRILLGRDDLTIHMFDIMGLLYGSRIRRHPRYFSMLDHLHLQIEAMVENGEVSYNDQYVHVTGQALLAIAQYEEDNRRHRSEVFRNWVMLALTLVIAVAAWVAIYIKP
ncbi:hypothetical protein [Aliiroseovarius lamellibrachiae]|uniref:hypothetical protein n=1 Tax=Aliiroseovarius lamellibrachiae TaxID=1924933 RepID=UPI001BE0F4DF|nr:hypothetical protein [Aliiroseovarius lamellibrachiae]MBT2131481.1 hypothetical protein [Aliiroseovarius lamellibrachiae]